MRSQEQFGILLVDDDPMVIRIMGHILSDFVPLRFATSGRSALKLAQESVPDLVLLDIDMPELSGFEVCKIFKSTPLLADVPIILLTSHDSPQLEAKAFALGAADFLSKPPHGPLVLARVRTYQRLKALSDTMRSAVKMDFLTGTITRREWEKALTQEWLRAQRTAAPLALLVMEIDGFTAYNAGLGEELGDLCLKSVAHALRSVTHRSTDLLGRFAGGSFALLLPETDSAGARTVAQRALVAIDRLQLPQVKSSRRDYVTLTVGGGYRTSSRSIPRQDGASSGTPPFAAAVPNDLIAAAEQALASAVSSGGHTMRFVDIANLDIPVAAVAQG